VRTRKLGSLEVSALGLGKIGGWGQSQATVEQIRRAHAVTPVTAIQSEYSIMERMFEKDVIPACEELGIGFVPFSPLASGFLSGKVTANHTYSGDDVRRVITRFDRDT
jgi:aryl-alcohol dehydrogenase-like predicted oxidoreductase